MFNRRGFAPQAKRYQINGDIRSLEVRLIDDEGEQLGVLSTKDAIKIAEEKDLDLLMVSPEAKPPVCKLIDFGQFKYQQSKKERISKKTNKAHILKEIKLSPKISIHDYNVRLDRGIKFLGKGYKIKITIMFRGREIVHKKLGIEVIDRYKKDIEEYGVPDSDIMDAHRSVQIHFKPK